MAFLENWNYRTNTLFVEDREMWCVFRRCRKSCAASALSG